MKNYTILILISYFALIANAQVSKTVNVINQGTLSTLASSYLTTVTNLTITGNIDARDFVTMRNNMPMLAVLDISGVYIAAYTGTAGTSGIEVWGYNKNVTYSSDEIPSYSFNKKGSENTMLKSITLPNSTWSIGDYAFIFCRGLSNVEIPNSVRTIGTEAFEGCISMTSMTIPNSITLIGGYAFANCSSLNSILVQANNTHYLSSDGVLYNKNQTTLIQYPIPRQGAYILPNSVTSIGAGAFDDCRGLTSISIPISVTSIGNSAFSGCIGLTNITIPTSVISIGSGAFSNCKGLTSISIPKFVKSIGSSAFSSCTSLTSFYSNSATPINLINSGSAFNSINLSTCILYVPIGSKSEYQAAYQWKDFVNIIEMSTTSLNSNSQSKIKISTDNRKLIIQNAKVGDKVEIYGISGIKIKEQSVISNLTKIQLISGIYIISIGNYSNRVIIR